MTEPMYVIHRSKRGTPNRLIIIKSLSDIKVVDCDDVARPDERHPAKRNKT